MRRLDPWLAILLLVLASCLLEEGRLPADDAAKGPTEPVTDAALGNTVDDGVPTEPAIGDDARVTADIADAHVISVADADSQASPGVEADGGASSAVAQTDGGGGVANEGAANAGAASMDSSAPQESVADPSSQICPQRLENGNFCFDFEGDVTAERLAQHGFNEQNAIAKGVEVVPWPTGQREGHAMRSTLPGQGGGITSAVIIHRLTAFSLVDIEFVFSTGAAETAWGSPLAWLHITPTLWQSNPTSVQLRFDSRAFAGQAILTVEGGLEEGLSTAGYVPLPGQFPVDTPVATRMRIDRRTGCSVQVFLEGELSAEAECRWMSTDGDLFYSVGLVDYGTNHTSDPQALFDDVRVVRY